MHLEIRNRRQRYSICRHSRYITGVSTAYVCTIASVSPSQRPHIGWCGANWQSTAAHAIMTTCFDFLTRLHLNVADAKCAFMLSRGEQRKGAGWSVCAAGWPVGGDFAFNDPWRLASSAIHCKVDE